MKPSIPVSGFTTTVPPPLFRLPQSHCLFLRRFTQTSPVKPNISGCSFPINNHSSRPLTVDNSQNQQPPPRRTLFPGGFKRAEINVPSLVLRLDADEILSSGEGDVLALVDRAVADAVGIVVLDGGAGGSSGGGKLYEAACLLKSVVKDRAYLMIAERVDIAAAVGANGVLLSDQGLPAIVARNSMINSKTESVILPLVGKIVRSKDAALNASNLEGADFLIYDTGEHSEGSFGVSSVLEGVKIPIFTVFSTYGGAATAAVATSQLGAGGLVVSLEDVRFLGAGALTQLVNGTYPLNSERQDHIDSFPKDKLLDSEHYLQEKTGLAGINKLKNKEKQLIEAEKSLLHEAIKVIQKAAPLMEEISLLIDAVSRIDEPFLLVIVGEFNSGKSTVINSLLGRRYLNEGVIPTTNEITFLRFSELESEDQHRCERHPDGQFICYLPAPILKDMTIVDTPGTNVILQRQQRLTEEFIPRADLLLFVISADRPLTESEVSFLQYTQQWKKKIVFVLNKSDIYRNAYELEEAVSFIKENTRNLLNSENVTLFPISARSALEAKLSDASSVGKDNSEFSEPASHLKTHSFQELERFLYEFLDGSTSMGMERIQLKLQTPTAITERLLSASESLVEQETLYAKQDLASANRMIKSINEYTIRMENESIAWRRQALSLIDVMKSRVIEVIESTLRISNLDIVTSYILKGEKSSRTSASSRFQIDILAPALLDVEKLLKEYAIWLKSNNTREGRSLVESFENKWPAIVQTKAQAHLETYELLKEIDGHSLKVIQDLSASSTSNLLEKEIQEVFMGTFSGLGVAGVSASLLTSVLPTTLEDLLALGLCSAGGYIAISRFPGRKRAIIDKVNKTADALALQLEDAMQKDLASTISSLEKFVKFIAKPYQEEAEGRLEKLSGIQSELSDVTKQLQILQVDIQNLHVL